MMETKIEYKLTEIGEIPVGWDVKKFSEVTKLITCGVAARPEYVEEGVPFLSSKNVKKNKIIFSGFNMISEEKHRELTKYNMPEKGDILYTRVGSFGEAAVIGELPEFSIFVSLTLIKPIQRYFNSYFLSYLLNSDMYKKLAKNGTTGLAVQNLNVSVVRNYPMIIPPLKEQQKIADILSTVDEQIEQTNQLIEKTKELKKGLMQQLLTKGIDHKEFKQSELGEIPVNWIVEKLEKTVHILDGKRRPIKKNDRISGDIPYYGATGIIDWVNNYLFNETLILVGEDGENLNSRVLPMAFKITGKTWINNHAHVLKPIENISIDYLTYFLESVNYSIYITGSAQPKLNQEQLRKILILIPPFLEQQKIADILSSIDEEMEGYKQEKCQYEELKKGLMQQLLTGKTRVKVD